jgi:UPF0755 protein
VKYSKNYGNKDNRIKFIVITLISIAALAILIASSFIFWYNISLGPVTKDSSLVTIEIPQGTTSNEAATLLKEEGIIKSDKAFMVYMRLNSGIAIKAGTYQIDTSLSTPEVISLISDGSKVVQQKVTILPGQRLDQIRQSLIKSGYSEAEVDTALSVSNYAGHPALINKPQSQSLEGYLYPETFSVSSQTSVSEIIEKSLDEMSNQLTPDLITAFKSQGLNIHQAVTLASIVIKESSNPIDQKTIAGVFYNRLNRGMPLGSDVTYQYVADITGQERSALIDSPYNTRIYTGLPPGPIANTNKSSLAAVAYPTATPYLYFVAGDDGKIYYGKNIQEHEENIRLHCIELCSTY